VYFHEVSVKATLELHGRDARIFNVHVRNARTGG